MPLSVKFTLYKEIILTAAYGQKALRFAGHFAGEPHAVSVDLYNVVGYNVVPAAYFAAVANFYPAEIRAAFYGILFYLRAEKRFVHRLNCRFGGLFITGNPAYFKPAVKYERKLRKIFVKGNFRLRKKLFALKSQSNIHFIHF